LVRMFVPRPGRDGKSPGLQAGEREGVK
jgi:hypothetical protein